MKREIIFELIIILALVALTLLPFIFVNRIERDVAVMPDTSIVYFADSNIVKATTTLE